MQDTRAKNTELKLLLACARWPQRASDQLLIAELGGQVRDWAHVVALARHHRVVPLVSRNLRAALIEGVPEPAEAAVGELRRDAAAAAVRSFQLLSELRRVVGALRAANVPVRVLKGFPLAHMVFGDIGLRAPGDLDLLIDHNQLLEADRVLRELGYTGLLDPRRFTPRQLAFYRAHWKDVTYTNDVLGIELDLHWRCFRNPRMPGGALCSTAATQAVRFGDLTLETMARVEGLLYLCVHGTLDGWIYLKSLTDVAAQVRELPERDMDELAELAQTHGVLPELTAALLLVRSFFAVDHWSARLLPENDRTVSHILRYVQETLEKRGFIASRDEIPIGLTLRFEWGLRCGFRYRREILRRVLYRARMWETIPLPDWLFWAYPLLSPVEWLMFRVRSKGCVASPDSGPGTSKMD